MDIQDPDYYSAYIFVYNEVGDIGEKRNRKKIGATYSLF